VTEGPKRHRVLLVEDDASVRQLVESHLRKRRFEVRGVGSGEEVLGEVRGHTLEYDLALVDVHLPGMTGVALTRLLLAARPLCPVLIITGDDDAKLAREALSAGASGYLLKPFQLFELDAAVSQAVSMGELVEATETLARAQSQGLNEWGESGGSLPRSWLHVGDEQSGAGPGHGARVVSIAGLLARKLGDEELPPRSRELLRTAARTHEIGRLTGSGARLQVARRSAKLLDDLGFDPGVCEIVRQAAEEWSPGLPLTARLLALADRLDHDATRRAVEGSEAEGAIRASVDAVVAGSGDAHDPRLGALLEREREQVESMWVLQSQVSRS
jgi:CheY-like chemotaxis protein